MDYILSHHGLCRFSIPRTRRWSVVGGRRFKSKFSIPLLLVYLCPLHCPISSSSPPAMAAAYPHPGGGVAASFAVFPPAVAAAAPSLIFFDDDDGFGDFEFAPISITTSHQPPDEDWGEFVSSPAGSRSASSPKTTQPQPSSFDAFLADPSPNSSKSSQKSAWEKPRGALPLSIFGEEDKEEEEEEEEERKKAGESPAFPSAGFAFSSSASLGRDEKGSPLASGDLTDLIKNLYSQTNGNGDVVTSHPAEGGVGEYTDEDEWEFKNSISSTAKEEGEQILDLSGKEKAPLDSSCVEVLDNRFGDTLQTAGQLDAINGSQGLANAFENHEGINGSWQGFTGTSPENNGNHEINHLPNGHVSDHTIENEGDDECWDFKGASSETKAVTSPWEEMNSSEAEFNIRNFSEKEDARSTSENNVNELTAHSYSNANEVKLVENGINGKTSVKGSYSNILNLYNKYEQPNAVQFMKDPADNGEASETFGYGDFHEPQTKVPNASEIQANNQKFMSEIDGILPLELTQDSSSDMYCRLRKGLTVLINHHLHKLKEAQEAAALSGEQAKATEIANEINAVYEKLSSSNLPDNDDSMNSLSRDVCVSLLLNQVGEPKIRVFEQEYHLSEKIRLADEKLGAAIKLLEHTNSMQSILALASNKDQIAYIAAWSNMSAVCARELKLGAAIWKKTLQAEASDKVLHQDDRYFLALGEIYRVAEILRASVELYRPWILSNWSSSSTVLSSLEECSKAWVSSGLEKTLEIISDSDNESQCGVAAKALLASIHKICDTNLQACDKTICGLSLLPAAALEDMQMKMVTWNGQTYCLKLANMWANRISCDPPQLPQQIYAR